jgi:hypothetical protein
MNNYPCCRFRINLNSMKSFQNNRTNHDTDQSPTWAFNKYN